MTISAKLSEGCLSDANGTRLIGKYPSYEKDYGKYNINQIFRIQTRRYLG